MWVRLLSICREWIDVSISTEGRNLCVMWGGETDYTYYRKDKSGRSSKLGQYKKMSCKKTVNKFLLWNGS